MSPGPEEDRRELGGEFPKLTPDELAPLCAGPTLAQLFPGHSLWGTGRAALLALVAHGRATRGWKRLLVPRYLCREVPDALAQARVPYATYPDDPLADFVAPVVGAGDVLLRVNTFGWRGPFADVACDTIDDHTHDPAGPGARESRATYAFASLRKTTPAPDGAVLWSPRPEPLPVPPPPTSEHLAAAELKLRGMEAKRQWLLGRGGRDHVSVLAMAERNLGRGSPSSPHPDSVAILERVSPVVLAEERRRAIESVLARVPARWRPPRGAPPGGSPFALVLDLGKERERVQRALHKERIYSQVLWPMPWTAWSARKVANRLLAIACDFRASDADLDRLAGLIARMG